MAAVRTASDSIRSRRAPVSSGATVTVLRPDASFASASARRPEPIGQERHRQLKVEVSPCQDGAAPSW